MATKKKKPLLIPIRIDQSHSDMIDLIDNQNIFSARNQIVIFASTIGFKYDMFAETKKLGHEGRRDQIDVDEALSKANFMALAKTEDKTILDDDDACYKILCGYANGGFEKLREWNDETSTEEGFLKHIINAMYQEAVENLPR